MGKKKPLSKIDSKKFPFVKLILPLIILAILGVLAFIFRDKYSYLFCDQDNGRESPFSSLVDETEIYKEAPEPDYTDIDYSTLDKSFLDEIQSKILLKGPSSMFDENWSWDKSWIFGVINDIDESSIDITIMYPDHIESVNAQYTFDSNKSVLLRRSNNIVMATNINVFDIAKPKYLVYTKCLNEECTQVGNSCILVKMD